jgi:hypothetical protein
MLPLIADVERDGILLHIKIHVQDVQSGVQCNWTKDVEGVSCNCTRQWIKQKFVVCPDKRAECQNTLCKVMVIKKENDQNKTFQ